MPKLVAISDARPVASDGDGLTEMQRAFVVAYTNGEGCVGNASEAARRAGYSVKTAKEIGRHLVAKPHVRDAIEAANREAISGRLSVKASALLERAIDDEAAPMRVRVQAALGVLDRGGYAAPSAFEKAAALALRERDKPLHQMTRAEVEARIAELSAEVGDRASPVLEGEAVPVDDGDPSQG
jgi:phage terminase small subunit